MRPPPRKSTYAHRRKLSVYLDAHEYEQLQARSAASNIPMSQLARKAVLLNYKIKESPRE